MKTPIEAGTDETHPNSATEAIDQALPEALDALEQWQQTGDRNVWQAWLNRWGTDDTAN